MYLAPDKSAQGGARLLGFTLVEVLVATSLLGLLAGSAIWALVQANNYASISRLHTGAEIAAQNQVDLLMADGPFNPPGELCSEYLPATTPRSFIWTLGQSVAQSVTIYTEPAGVSGPHTVTGQMVTTVAKCILPLINGTDLNVYSATVVVTYTYRNKDYRVQLNTLRSSDV